MLTDNNIPLQHWDRTSLVVTRIVHNTIPSTWGVNYVPSYRVTQPLEISLTRWKRDVQNRFSTSIFFSPLFRFCFVFFYDFFYPYSLTSQSSCPHFSYLILPLYMYMYSCRMLVGITLNSRVIIVSNSSSSSGANENVERYSVAVTNDTDKLMIISTNGRDSN